MTRRISTLLGHIMRLQLVTILLCIGNLGCRTHHPSSVTSAPPTPPEVISMPLGFAASPALTPAQIRSIHSLLSKQDFKEMADLRAVLPGGLRFMPVSHALMSPIDANGRARPYTEMISVCRLSEHRDVVVVEDNRTGKNIIQRWFIRDLPAHR